MIFDNLMLMRAIAAMALVATCPAGAAPARGDLYPKGETFCFSFYSARAPEACYSLTNGATAIGPFYGSQAAPLASAIRWDTKLIYKVRPPCMAGITSVAQFDLPGYVWPAPATISNEVAAIVDAVHTNRHIAFWDIEPEELRSWKPDQLRYLQLVSSAIRAHDPERRPVYLYECNNRAVPALAPSLVSQDISAKGSYVNVVDDGVFVTNRIWMRWSMEQELEAIASGNSNAVPWIVLWMAADPPGESFNSITNWCRHDAYLGLIMGGKGIQVWSGSRGRRGFSDRAFDAYLNGYLTVARDLNGPLHLAPVFLFGKKDPKVRMSITSGPAKLRLSYQKSVNYYPSVTCLSTVYGGTNYLFMVNSAQEAVTAVFDGLPASDRRDLFAGTVSAMPAGWFSTVLAPLEVKAFCFSLPGPAAKTANSSTAAPIRSGISAAGSTPP